MARDSDDTRQAWQRLDKWLWCARFLRGREDCARLIAAGALRVNRQPTGKPHLKLRVGDVITMALRAEVRVVEVLALAERRGPASAAQALYRIIPPAGSDPALTAERNAAVHTISGGGACGGDETAAYRNP